MKKFLIMLTIIAACLMAFTACDSEKTPGGTTTDSKTTVDRIPDETVPSADTGSNDENDGETTTPEAETVHTHAWGDWSTNKEATCTEAGVSERTCACGEKEEETIDALGHTPGAEATCTAAQTCTVCGTELTAAMGHTEVVDAAVAPTVTETGLTEGKHCSVCDEILVEQEVLPATGSLGLAYELNDGGTAYIVTGIGTCEDSAVYIPEVYNGLPVREIARRAFYECQTITEITIPASIKTIGPQIFFKAENLHTAYYNSLYGSEDNPFFSQSSVEKIVFGGKTVPTYILYKNSADIDVVISDSVTSIGDGAFWGCTDLASIEIPDSVTSIGWSAFYGCTGTSIEIPNSVTSIEVGAFNGCTGLTSIEIPDGVTEISDETFMDCTGLTSIKIPDSVTSIGYRAFSGCTGLTSIEIPDSVMSIEDLAFMDCTGLTSIEIPDSVTSIGYCMFSGCTSLTSIEVPDSVAIIDARAFKDCTSLTSIEIPDSVTSIVDSAFSGCTNLTSITISDSVTRLGDYAFYRSGLTDIYYTGTQEQWDAISKGNNLGISKAEIHYNA